MTPHFEISALRNRSSDSGIGCINMVLQSFSDCAEQAPASSMNKKMTLATSRLWTHFRLFSIASVNSNEHLQKCASDVILVECRTKQGSRKRRFRLNAPRKSIPSERFGSYRSTKSPW